MENSFIQADSKGEVIRRQRKPWARERLVTVVEGESATAVHMLQETDINNIVEKFHRTGLMPPANRDAQYGDVTALQGDLTETLNKTAATLQTVSDYAAETAERAEAEQAALLAQQQADAEAYRKLMAEKSDTDIA